MGSDLYYFCSQLPGLAFGARPPFSCAEFRQRAAALLSERDAALIALCVYPPSRAAAVPQDCAYDRFRTWNFALIGEVARLRTAAHPAADVTYAELPPETDGFAYVKEDAAAAARAADPLERERVFDRIRWAKLDDLAAGRGFTLDEVMIYFLKLAILEKHQAFAADAGLAAFEAALEAIDRDSASG